MVKKQTAERRLERLDVGSLDDLEQLGSFRAVKHALQRRLGAHVRLRPRGWSELHDAVVRTVGTFDTVAPSSNDYFVSPAAEKIFAAHGTTTPSSTRPGRFGWDCRACT